jgi:Tat protein secretion system quality control protein TatD with DNase activity
MQHQSGGQDASNEANKAFPWHLGVYDAHCHPTDIMSSIDDIPKMKARVLTVMATRRQDQELVMETNKRLGLPSADISSTLDQAGCRILPAFGWHPWFSHQLYDDREDPEALAPSKLAHYRTVVNPSPNDESFIDGLPSPRPLSQYLAQTKVALATCPLAMVGEIGLDKSFRIPETTGPPVLHEAEPDKTPGSRDGRKLSPYRVDLRHQQTLLKAQLHLAGGMGRAVSVHGVAAHGVLFETLQSTWKGHEKRSLGRRERKQQESTNTDQTDDEDESGREAKEPDPKPFPPRICLHSYSGSAEQVKQYLHPSVPATVFFSFSKAINFSTSASERAIEVIKALPSDRILVESDLHCAGERMDQMLEDMACMICQFKGWALEDGVPQLASNWKHFAFGHA